MTAATLADHLGSLESTLNEALDQPWRGLRSDLRLHPEVIDADGSHWLLEDPVSGHTWTLARDEYRLFHILIEARSLSDALARYLRRYKSLPSADEMLHFLRLLQQSNLTRSASAATMLPQQPLLNRWLGKFIYLRIPLLQPDRFLTRFLPWVKWLWHPFVQGLWLGIGLLGVALVLPQYEQYLASAGYLFTPKGALLFAVALALLKIGHEFSHAFVAKAQGLYVRSIGVALIAFWPVLFTDTTEAWKLADRRQRAWIDGAGIGFELTIAGIALLAWSAVPDGALRNLLFFISGISIVTSAFVNLNPLMRFDGYYLLMDRWGIDNLQPRANAILKHTFRRALWDWQGPVPEIHPQQASMRIYAALVSLYRIFIAISIATILYKWLDPLVGILVFTAVLWMMLAAPILTELRYLWENRRLMGKTRRILMTLAGIALLIVLLCIPLRGAQNTPGLWLYAASDRISNTNEGRLLTAVPQPGTRVKAGEVIVRIESEGLARQIEQATLEIRQNELRLNALGTAGEQGGYRRWLVAELQRQQAERQRLQEAQRQLTITASEDRLVVAANDALAIGAPLATDTWILTVADDRYREVHALIHEQELDKLIRGDDYREAEIRFPGTGLAPVAGVLRERREYPLRDLPNDALFDVTGGPIPSIDNDGVLTPRDTWYVFVYRSVEPVSAVPHGAPVQVWLGSERQSTIAGWWESLLRILNQEGIR